MPHVQKLVLLRLAWQADDANRCFPSANHLATKTGLSVRSVRTALSALKRAGMLTITPRHQASGRQSSSLFTLCVDQAPAPGSVHKMQRRECASRTGEGAVGAYIKEKYENTINKNIPLTAPKLDRNVPRAKRAESLFDEFWTIYPRQIGRDRAAAAWRKAVIDDEPRVIVDALRAQVRDGRLPGDRSYILSPASWLAKGRWLDEFD